LLPSLDRFGIKMIVEEGKHLFGNAEFLIFASIIKNVNVVSYMAVFFESELRVTVKSNV